jgi:hypothetical protein
VPLREPFVSTRTQLGSECKGSGGEKPQPLKPGLLGPGDDLVLERRGQVAEVVAVAGHPHDQVAVRGGW